MRAVLGRPGITTPGAVTVEDVLRGVVVVSWSTGMLAPFSDAEVFVVIGGVPRRAWFKRYQVQRGLGLIGGAPPGLPPGAVGIGPPGPPGPPGEDGTDGEDGEDGTGTGGGTVVPGIPPGGLPGQVLAKTGTADFTAAWIDPPASTGAGGDTLTFNGEALTFSASA